MDSSLEVDEVDAGEALIRELEQARGAVCPDCGAGLCAHQVLMNIALGFKANPRCLACLGERLGQDTADLTGRLVDHLTRRECHKKAWAWADQQEPGAENGARPWPSCLAPAVFNGAEVAERVGIEPRKRLEAERLVFAASASAAGGREGLEDGDPPEAREEWDAGEMGCGDLVLELRLRLGKLRPGEVLRLCARDPGAPEDLPAWCRLTGHGLLRARHPDYWIKRKE